MENLIDFLHYGAQYLIKLQRGSERLAQLVKNGNFTAIVSLAAHHRVAAAFGSGKGLRFRHFGFQGTESPASIDRFTVGHSGIIGLRMGYCNRRAREPCAKAKS